MKIISKGMMDCWGEFIALFMAGTLAMCWVSIYMVTDRHIEDEGIHEPNGDGQRNPAVTTTEIPVSQPANADAAYAARL